MRFLICWIPQRRVLYFIMIVCAGANYALELAVNLILAPALERILRMVNRQLLR